jgi:hypothetical protein
MKGRTERKNLNIDFKEMVLNKSITKKNIGINNAIRKYP